jgi:hypothetical protein
MDITAIIGEQLQQLVVGEFYDFCENACPENEELDKPCADCCLKKFIKRIFELKNI